MSYMSLPKNHCFKDLCTPETFSPGLRTGIAAYLSDLCLGAQTCFFFPIKTKVIWVLEWVLGLFPWSTYGQTGLMFFWGTPNTTTEPWANLCSFRRKRDYSSTQEAHRPECIHPGRQHVRRTTQAKTTGESPPGSGEMPGRPGI